MTADSAIVRSPMVMTGAWPSAWTFLSSGGREHILVPFVQLDLVRNVELFQQPQDTLRAGFVKPVEDDCRSLCVFHWKKDGDSCKVRLLIWSLARKSSERWLPVCAAPILVTRKSRNLLLVPAILCSGADSQYTHPRTWFTLPGWVY